MSEQPEKPTPFNLDPLLTDREDCLAIAANPVISDTKLVGAEIQFDTEHKSRISYQAKDLFATEEFQTTLNHLSFKRAHVTQITVDFHLAGVAHPCTVLFVAPGTVKFTDKCCGGPILAWLTQSIFCRLARLAKTSACKLLLALALGLAAASSCPGLDTDNDDTPDDPEHTHSLSAH